jgi:soluble lytic murein transglycosylase-like protein
LGAALREWLFGIVLLLLQTVALLQAMAQVPKSVDQTSNTQNSICPVIEAAAKANWLPVEFFARLIWQESRFKPDEVGPVTRSGERAQGIAQFMPSTAVERQLYEPFNPVEALPKSGQFLAELRDEFGNLGLATAAYNAGPQRVRDFLAGTRDLPVETRNYVHVITGRPVEDWVSTKEEPTPDGEQHDDRETGKLS